MNFQEETIKILIDHGIEFVFMILQAIIITLVGKWIIEHQLSDIINSNRLKQYGIKKINAKGIIPKWKIVKMFNEANEVYICFVNGNRFFKQYENEILKFKERGGKLKILLCDEKGKLVRAIDETEKACGWREQDNSINVETQIVKKHFEKIEVDTDTRVNRYMYHFPYIIAQYNDDEKKMLIAYVNIVIPPRKAAESICIEAEASKTEYQKCLLDNHIRKKKKNFAVDLYVNFQYVWEKCKQNK